MHYIFFLEFVEYATFGIGTGHLFIGINVYHKEVINVM